MIPARQVYYTIEGIEKANPRCKTSLCITEVAFCQQLYRRSEIGRRLRDSQPYRREPTDESPSTGTYHVPPLADGHEGAQGRREPEESVVILHIPTQEREVVQGRKNRNEAERKYLGR